jgi:hypothetical protein
VLLERLRRAARALGKRLGAGRVAADLACRRGDDLDRNAEVVELEPTCLVLGKAHAAKEIARVNPDGDHVALAVRDDLQAIAGGRDSSGLGRRLLRA